LTLAYQRAVAGPSAFRPEIAREDAAAQPPHGNPNAADADGPRSTGLKQLERFFESLLWNSRFLTLIAVVASLVGALVMFYVAGLDVLSLFGQVAQYSDHSLSAAQHHSLRAQIVASVAQFIDGFLFALVLIIFALGIYELFIGRIDAAEHSELAERILVIHSLDELKEKLAKVIFLILIVRYFEYALDTEITTTLELLSLAAGILFIAVAIYFTKPKDGREK
jgi:uncharacterized membrane protein YqhA